MIDILGVKRSKTIRRWISPSQQSTRCTFEEGDGELWLMAVILEDVHRYNMAKVAHLLQLDALSGHFEGSEDWVLVESV